MDTSTSDNANADWRIYVNSGIAESFNISNTETGKIVFRVMAGKGSVYIDPEGHTGFGTSVPVTSLHSVHSDTPALRLDQDGSAGFEPQIWDVAGNESRFFVRDVTNSSTIPFEIQAGAPEHSLQVLSNGNVVVAGDLAVGSSREIKHGIEPADTETLLDSLMEMGVYEWTYNNDTDGVRHLGPIAEDFHATFGLGRDPQHLSPGDSAGVRLGGDPGAGAATGAAGARDRGAAHRARGAEVAEACRWIQPSSPRCMPITLYPESA